MSAQDEANALARRRGPDVKAHVFGGERETKLATRVAKELSATDPAPSNVDLEVDEAAIATRAAAVDPPYDPETLLIEFENSNALRQNIDAYSQNIDGFGYRFEATIDLDADDVDAIISNALVLDRFEQAQTSMQEFDWNYQPTPDDIEKAKQLIRRRMELERGKLDLFFAFCVSDRSFTELRKNSRMESEIIGFGFWEVRRNLAGKLAAFSYVPSFTIRAVDLGRDDVIEREVPIKISPLRWGTRREMHVATRWVQVVAGKDPLFFKEFGDKRLISSRSGAVFPTVEEMQKVDGPDAKPATELAQPFRVHSPRSGKYGVPRWIGNLKSVLGSKKAEMVNLLYFNNKSVPPLAVLVSGGSLTESAVERIKDYVENELKGDESNFHKILVIEASPASAPMDFDTLNSGKVRIEIVPLTAAIHNDALFMKYISVGREMIGESMRNPRIVRGSTENVNRATAQAALEFAEAQVYQPERAGFDWWINRFIIPELGILFWEFHSNSPVATDLDAAKAIVELTKAGVLTPAEARRLTSRVFNTDLRNIKAQWVNQPLQLTLAGILMDDSGMSTGLVEHDVDSALTGSSKMLAKVVREARKNKRDVVAEVEKLLKLRGTLVEEERVRADKTLHETKATDDAPPEEVTLKLPGSIDQYFVPSKPDA